MAQRRMFSKTITMSSGFMMMPPTCQLLYFHLGMSADDDGFCEHFTVMRMTDSKPDDLAVLEAKGYVRVFDDKVLVIKDWKENNYIQSDRYRPSKYLDIYKEKIKEDTACIQDVSKTDTQVRLGKVRLGKVRLGKVINNKASPSAPPEPEAQFGKEDINWLIRTFTERMGFGPAGGRDRNYATHLLRNFTRPQLETMILYCATEKYAPRVGSLEKLWFKRGDIIAGLQKKVTNPDVVDLTDLRK